MSPVPSTSQSRSDDEDEDLRVYVEVADTTRSYIFVSLLPDPDLICIKGKFMVGGSRRPSYNLSAEP